MFIARGNNKYQQWKLSLFLLEKICTRKLKIEERLKNSVFVTISTAIQTKKS